MVRLDINKILRHARHAEQKFAKVAGVDYASQKKTVLKKSESVLPKKSMFSNLLSSVRNMFLAGWSLVCKLFKRKPAGQRASVSKKLGALGSQLGQKLQLVKKINSRILVGILLIFISVLFIPFVMNKISMFDCENDIACFGALADECKSAKYTGTIAGATVVVQTQNCQLTKKITALPDTEPEAIKELFVGKSMECKYPVQEFDSVYLTKLTGKIQTCTGELVKAIQVLSAAQ